MDYITLRNTYSRFVFHGFETASQDEHLKISFHFEIEGLAAFHPTWVFPNKGSFINSDPQTIRAFAFALGMVELISYWKITCCPQVIIRAGMLDERQIAWWKKLYFKGLGEFFYINSIHTSMEDFMQLQSTADAPPYPMQLTAKLTGNLIPIGGGKDSVVTLDLLQAQKNENLCYMVNQTKARIGTAETAGYPPSQQIIARRSLDKRMLELNREGYLNGHTPLSAVIAFSGALSAYLYGKKYIVLSNESSANDYTVTEAEVNHQYSKSFEFETDFQAYLNTYLSCGLVYFSLLRSLCELQITSHFAKLTAYHAVFNSCNLGSKFDGWCLDCPKCLFIYIMLSPFLSQEQLASIFSVNLLDQARFQFDLEQLTGRQPNKPFECVGSRDEVNAALVLTIARLEQEGAPLPYLLNGYKQTEQYMQSAAQPFRFSEHYDAENAIPRAFSALLTQHLLRSEGTKHDG